MEIISIYAKLTPPEQRPRSSRHVRSAVSMPVRTPIDLEESIDVLESIARASYGYRTGTLARNSRNSAFVRVI